MSYMRRKVTVKFTAEDYDFLETAAAEMDSLWSKNTVSKYLRHLVQEARRTRREKLSSEDLEAVDELIARKRLAGAFTLDPKKKVGQK